jgi:hypothetical protein
MAGESGIYGNSQGVTHWGLHFLNPGRMEQVARSRRGCARLLPVRRSQVAPRLPLRCPGGTINVPRSNQPCPGDVPRFKLHCFVRGRARSQPRDHRRCHVPRHLWIRYCGGPDDSPNHRFRVPPTSSPCSCSCSSAPLRFIPWTIPSPNPGPGGVLRPLLPPAASGPRFLGVSKGILQDSSECFCFLITSCSCKSAPSPGIPLSYWKSLSLDPSPRRGIDLPGCHVLRERTEDTQSSCRCAE